MVRTARILRDGRDAAIAEYNDLVVVPATSELLPKPRVEEEGLPVPPRDSEARLGVAKKAIRQPKVDALVVVMTFVLCCATVAFLLFRIMSISCTHRKRR